MLGFKSIKKLFGGLAKTREDLTRRLTDALGGGRLDEAALEAIEEALIGSDVGVGTAARVMEAVRESARGKGTLTGQELRGLVAAELAASLGELSREEASASAGTGPGTPRGAGTGSAPGAKRPEVLLVVGVNGGGKTTTVAKLAARMKADGRSVLLAAADTFRAAATEQLVTWGDRAGVAVIKHDYGADPGAVVFDAARAAQSRGSDVLIVDTAGRLHTKSNLMQELVKIARVAGREIPGAPHEVLLVLDATTGQNGLAQAREFTRAVPVTGLVVTKLDGTARGGVALAIARELRIPIRYIGVGEGMDDLLDFDPSAFVSSLLGEEPVAGAGAGGGA
jgi:fused signal recognition particle receptor